MPHAARETAVLALVFDRAGLGDDPAARVRGLVDAGVDWLQVRDRSLEADALFALTCAVVQGARAAGRPASVIVNRRIDVALAAGADGAHLGFDALGVDVARALMGARSVIGVSCHALGDVHDAAEQGADYVHLAPIFDPISKPASRPALGLDVVREAARAGVPVLAQGGLDAARARAALRAGAAGVAVTGDVLRARDPVAAVRALRAALDVP